VIVKKPLALPISDWHDTDGYAYTQNLGGADWAWEFLRSDPGFRQHAVELCREPRLRLIEAGLWLAESSVLPLALARYGLLFFRRCG
jgi:hypothetical protein